MGDGMDGGDLYMKRYYCGSIEIHQHKLPFTPIDPLVDLWTDKFLKCICETEASTSFDLTSPVQMISDQTRDRC